MSKKLVIIIEDHEYIGRNSALNALKTMDTSFLDEEEGEKKIDDNTYAINDDMFWPAFQQISNAICCVKETSRNYTTLLDLKIENGLVTATFGCHPCA
jgi:hypothetical protein